MIKKPSPDARATKTPASPLITDDALRGLFGYNVKRAFSALQVDLVRVLGQFDLRMLTFSALVMIVKNPGLRQSQLADALTIERPNLVVILDELERRELITRDRVAQDRRAYALQATLAGHRLRDQAYDAVVAHEERYLAGFTPAQQDILKVGLNAIENAQKEAT